MTRRWNLQGFNMVTPRKTTVALLGVVLALVSCAAPKAIVAEQVAVPTKVEKAPEAVVSEPAIPALPDDGIRMPDMLGMPSEGDFRATNPLSPKTGAESGAVISRPPTDPPSRVKPKAAE